MEAVGVRLEDLQDPLRRSAKDGFSPSHSDGPLNQTGMCRHLAEQFIVMLQPILQPKLLEEGFLLSNEISRRESQIPGKPFQGSFIRWLIQIVNQYRLDAVIPENLHGFSALASAGVVIDQNIAHFPVSHLSVGYVTVTLIPWGTGDLFCNILLMATISH